MASNTSDSSGARQTAATTLDNYTTGFVTASDGATIGFRQLGQGPGLVLLHGAMSSAHNHMQLATLLAEAFTLYIPDRRGRGMSGPYANNYSIQQDIADMEALLAVTGAHNVFGVSSGGIIWLQAALSLAAIQKAAIYEPPLFMNKQEPTAILTRFDREMAQGKLAAALVTGMKGAQMGPAIFNMLPGWLLARLTNMAMNGEEKKGTNGYVSMRALAPTLHYDFHLVAELSGNIERFRNTQAEVLLLGGSKSPAYLKAALDALEEVLPHARRIEFAGLDHAASWNSDRGGHPQPLAVALRRFFA
jgi:pimeloyl-ACP methyl ester carboxylesterase